MNRTKIKTGISQAYWCSMVGDRALFEPLRQKVGESTQTISWFDRLFDGGVLLPEEESGPLTFLITGPPGSGKTTLALEMCYRLARNLSEDNECLNETSLLSAYISTDTSADNLLKNAISFGWKEADTYIRKYQDKIQENKAVIVWGKDQIKRWDKISDIVDTALSAIGQWILKTDPEKVRKSFHNYFKANKVTGEADKIAPDILVIDSLNVLDPDMRGELFQQFLKETSDGIKMVIFVLDSGSEEDKHMYWEYVCDTVLRLDYSYLDDYYVRSLEIKKARYQSTIWGKQQLKIYSKLEESDGSTLDQNVRLRRAHPYRKEGGVFIFPSIHYYLSTYKRLSSSEPAEFVESWSETFNRIIKFPEGRCTAFIGERGGHKSHLSYVHMLYRLLKHDEAGLVISLREDEGMTKRTMQQILTQEKGRIGDEYHVNDLNLLEKANQLEILYFPPGYITPEEFFHRVFMSVHRLKLNNKKLTVLFNSLDQLSARFPLCAKQEIFIPGMIEALSGENITSIFIAVDEQGQPIEQYGLLPMADLIISFYRYRFRFEDYFHHLNKTWNFDDGKWGKPIDQLNKLRKEYEKSYREEIVIEVERFAGGQKSGARGILELADAMSLQDELFNKPGLYFSDLDPNYNQGKRVRNL